MFPDVPDVSVTGRAVIPGKESLGTVAWPCGVVRGSWPQVGASSPWAVLASNPAQSSSEPEWTSALSWAWSEASCRVAQEGPALRVTGEAGMTVVFPSTEQLPAGPLHGGSTGNPHTSCHIQTQHLLLPPLLTHSPWTPLQGTKNIPYP